MTSEISAEKIIDVVKSKYAAAYQEQGEKSHESEASSLTGMFVFVVAIIGIGAISGFLGPVFTSVALGASMFVGALGMAKTNERSADVRAQQAFDADVESGEVFTRLAKDDNAMFQDLRQAARALGDQDKGLKEKFSIAQLSVSGDQVAFANQVAAMGGVAAARNAINQKKMG